jgi:hypothetical protein
MYCSVLYGTVLQCTAIFHTLLYCIVLLPRCQNALAMPYRDLSKIFKLYIFLVKNNIREFGCFISCFFRELDDYCVLVVNYPASCDNFLSTFWDKRAATYSGVNKRNPLVFPTHKIGNGGLCRNVHKELPLVAT